MPFRLQKENSTVHVADDESNSKSSQKMELKDVYLDAKKKNFFETHVFERSSNISGNLFYYKKKKARTLNFWHQN